MIEVEEQHGHRTGPAQPWVEHAGAELRRAGYRSGGARRAIIDVLAAAACAQSAAEIEASLEAAGRTVGRASVYRTLDQLEELGLIQRLDLGHGDARYERVEPDGDHHHHLVCDDCGRVLPFEDETVERAVHSVEPGPGFRVTHHEIVLHGSCEDCAA